jgi:MFS transporter, putative metabolite:H+ symporter
MLKIEKLSQEQLSWIAVIVAALGYFVDVFDMWLFGNFRVASLEAMGLSPQEVTDTGIMLINWQQAGFLIGGFIWGVMGDKLGRMRVMFGSIFIYSLATFLNAFVSTIPQYAVLRFVSGLGLAGEIGAGITLVVELLPRTKRGIGTTFVCVLGVSGAVAAALAGKYLNWKTAYILGGIMGFALLGLRLLVHESGMFNKMKECEDTPKGSLLLLFGNWKRFIRYLSCVALGIPIYLVMGLLISFSPEIAGAYGIKDKVLVPDVMIYGAIGLTIGDLLAGVLSQYLQSRKRAILICLILSTVFGLLIALGVPKTIFQYKVLIAILALFSGYWACLITTAAEQFGTNIRATVTTTVPNIIRGASILLTFSFAWLKPFMGISNAVLLITCAVFTISFIALWGLDETFHRDLDYLETKKP